MSVGNCLYLLYGSFLSNFSVEELDIVSSCKFADIEFTQISAVCQMRSFQYIFFGCAQDLLAQDPGRRPIGTVFSQLNLLSSWCFIALVALGEQEQTKFDDLRRGITQDFQRLAKF